jgi:VCBS repeat-containing protein
MNVGSSGGLLSGTAPGSAHVTVGGGGADAGTKTAESSTTATAKPKPKPGGSSRSDVSASSVATPPKRLAVTTKTAATDEAKASSSTQGAHAGDVSVSQASAPSRRPVPVELAAPPAGVANGTASDQAVQVLASAPAAPKSAVSRWTVMLSAMGFAESATGDDPHVPPDSPPELIGLAVLRRQTQRQLTEDALSTTAAQPQQSSLTLLTADSLQAQPMRTTATAVNSPPDARDDAYSTAANTTLTVASTNSVLQNDTDANRDKLRVTSNTAPSQGTLTMSSTGQFTYVPKANFVGTDSFNYTISDGKGGTDTATVTITVTAVNKPPDAINDAYTVAEDSVLSVTSTSSVLKNDVDPNGDPLTVTSKTAPAHGTLTMDSAGQFTYTPTANFNGTDSFNYTVSDGKGGTDTATVTLTVTPVNDAPDAINDGYTVAEDSVLTVSLTNSVLKNDVDPDSDPLTVTSTTAPAHGTLTMSSTGQFTYTPSANYNGTDSFTYTISDGKGGTDTATVNLTVTPVNDAPDAKNDTYTVAENSVLSVTSTNGVLKNDVDADNDAITVTGNTAPAHGTVTMSSTGQFTYTPAPNYTGTDSFTYTVSDGKGGTDTATVALTVTATAFSVSSISVSSPTAVAVDGNQAYVWSNTWPDTLSVVDISTKQVSETTYLWTDPTATSPTGDRRYAINDRYVSVINNADNSVIANIYVPVCSGCEYGNPGGLHDLVVSPDGTRVYVSDNYASELSQTTAVSVIDATTNTYLYTVAAPPMTDLDVSRDGTRLYGGDIDNYNADVLVFDRDMNLIGTVPLTPNPYALAWVETVAFSSDGTRLYALYHDADTRTTSVAVIDTSPTSPAYNTKIATITPSATALSPDSSRQYVLQPDGKTVVVYDTATNTAVGSFVTDQNSSSGDRSIAVAPDGTLYITDSADNKVYVVTVGSTAQVM